MIQYDVIWVENGRMLFKQFNYDGDIEFPIKSCLPEEVFKFYEEKREKTDVIVSVGEYEKTGTGILRYTGASPVIE